MDQQVKDAIERYDLELEEMRMRDEFDESQEGEDLNEWLESIGESSVS